MAVKETTSIDVQTLRPFKKLIMTLGLLPTSYLESMTYAELVMWFCNFLQEQVIPTVNNNAEAIIELQNWFNNLDVQDEIDTKLDEMVEDGTLQEIIADYLNSKAVFGFDTVADMKSATNLIDGSYAKTLGYYSVNDGGASLYKITDTSDATVHQETLDSGLYATLIVDDIINIKQIGVSEDLTSSEATTKLNYVLSKYSNILMKDIDLTINDDLAVQSNQNIKLENCNILNETTTNSKNIFNIYGKENVTITGTNSSLSFNKPSTTQQACLKILNSKNVIFDGIDLLKAGGDGIACSGTDDTTISQNIHISNCVINNNRRNGVSLIGGVKDFIIEKCTITNTSGTNPQYGIDLEPWQHEEQREGSNIGVIIRECTFEGNTGGGIDIVYYNKNVTIENNIFNNNRIQSVVLQAKGEDAYAKNVLINNNTFNSGAGIYFRGTQFAEYTISNNKFSGGGAITTDSESDYTQFYSTNPKNGYLVIKNNVIKNANNNAITLNACCNVLIDGNLLEKTNKRHVYGTQNNNINFVNNSFIDHAQIATNPETFPAIELLTTHNIKINNNIFINKDAVTFSKLIAFGGGVQKVIVVDNNALNSTYTNFETEAATISNKVITNNLTN